MAGAAHRGRAGSRPADHRQPPPSMGPPGRALPPRRVSRRHRDGTQDRRVRLRAMPRHVPRRRTDRDAARRRDGVRQRRRRHERQRHVRTGPSMRPASSAMPTSGTARVSGGCWTRISGPAQDGSAASARYRPGTRTRRRCIRRTRPHPAYSPIPPSGPVSGSWPPGTYRSTPGSCRRRSANSPHWRRHSQRRRSSSIMPVPRSGSGGTGDGGTKSLPTGQPPSGSSRPAPTSR